MMTPCLPEMQPFRQKRLSLICGWTSIQRFEISPPAGNSLYRRWL